jgi:Co/Zn/Cd efflux system component
MLIILLYLVSVIIAGILIKLLDPTIEFDELVSVSVSWFVILPVYLFFLLYDYLSRKMKR